MLISLVLLLIHSSSLGSVLTQAIQKCPFIIAGNNHWPHGPKRAWSELSWKTCTGFLWRIVLTRRSFHWHSTAIVAQLHNIFKSWFLAMNHHNLLHHLLSLAVVFQVGVKTKKLFGSRDFSNSASRLWAALLQALRDSRSSWFFSGNSRHFFSNQWLHHHPSTLHLLICLCFSSFIMGQRHCPSMCHQHGFSVEIERCTNWQSSSVPWYSNFTPSLTKWDSGLRWRKADRDQSPSRLLSSYWPLPQGWLRLRKLLFSFLNLTNLAMNCDHCIETRKWIDRDTVCSQLRGMIDV